MTSIEPLLATKFYFPQARTGLVQRPHLFGQLNSGMSGSVTLVSAPAGYGKTTLLSAWVSQLEIPVAWLSLDDNDNRLEIFLTYLVTAIQRCMPGMGEEVLAALEQSQSPQAEILLTLLINDIDASGQKFSLVLDDCHLITNPEIFDAIDYLIKYKPQDFHITLAGRVVPMISLPKLRADGQLTEIGSSDLNFSLEESERFLNQILQLDLSLEDVEELHKSTEGWIASMQLAALSLQKLENKHAFIQSFSGVHHHLIDYLVDEVLELQTPEIKSFLCRSSILDRFNAPLCDATLEIENSRELIRDLLATNMFLIPMDDEHRWYRYHHLFSTFLNLCLKVDEVGSIPELHANAARWLAGNGYDAEAYDHLFLSEDFDEAATFVESKALSMLEKSEFPKLISWVDALPQANIDMNPRLGIYYAWALRLSGNPFDLVENMIDSIESVLETLSADNEYPAFTSKYKDTDDELRNLNAHLLALRAFQGIYRQEPSAAIEFAEKAIALEPDEDYTLSGLNFVLGWGYRLSGDLPAAHAAFSSSSRLSKNTGNTYMAVSTLTRAAYGFVLAGELLAGEAELQTALELSTADRKSINPVAGFAQVYLAGINLEWNNFQVAKDQVFEGIQLVERVGQIFDQVVGYSFLARIYLAEGDLESAADACLSSRELSGLMGDYLYARRWAEDCQVRVWAAQGNIIALEDWVGTCGIDPLADPDFTRDVDQLILARAFVEICNRTSTSPHLDQSLTLLDKLEKMVRDKHWNGKLIEILLLKARCLQMAGMQDEAIISLQYALSLGENQGYKQSYISEGSQIKHLLLDENFKGDNYAQKILTYFDEVPQTELKSALEELVEPLSSRELDVLHMLITELSGPEIAAEMNIALSTLRFHTRNIYGKLQVSNRRSAVRAAQQLNLV
jgi:LuxR family maltose regulon positive regulatory protein